MSGGSTKATDLYIQTTGDSSDFKKFKNCFTLFSNVKKCFVLKHFYVQRFVLMTGITGKLSL